VNGLCSPRPLQKGERNSSAVLPPEIWAPTTKNSTPVTAAPAAPISDTMAAVEAVTARLMNENTTTRSITDASVPTPKAAEIPVSASPKASA